MVAQTQIQLVMLKVYTFWSRYYNEVIIIVAYTYDEASIKLHDIYMPGCDTDDWIIGGSINCREGQSMSVNIIK